MLTIRFFIVLSLVLLCYSVENVQAAELRVAVSIPPQKWLATQIGGELISTKILLDAGQSPHSFVPTPKQIATLFDADIYFLIGVAFEQQVHEKIRQADNHPKMIDTTLSIKRIPIQHNHDDGKPCPCGSSHSAGYGLDPHVWLSPANLLIMAYSMAESLAEADPKNSHIYADNLQKLISTLNRHDEQIRNSLIPYQGEAFFVFHPAFGYFAHAYGLKQEAVEVAGKKPTPRQLAALVEKIKEAQARVIFIQPGFDQRTAQIIADIIDGNLVTIDPLAEDVLKTIHTLAKEIRFKNRRPYNNDKYQAPVQK